jgi:hypothetical protein
MVQKAKKLKKNDFFLAYADAELASNYFTSIVGKNRIIPAFACARKKSFFLAFWLFVPWYKTSRKNTKIIHKS